MTPSDPTQPKSSASTAPNGRPGRRRTRRPLLVPFLFYALFGAFFLIPFTSSQFVESPAADLYNHVSKIVDARAAMAEGQFPVRVAPHQADKTRLAIFQFYANLPNTAGALLTMKPFGVHPYTAWKLVTLITLALAGWYTYRCGLTLTRQVWPSLIAGAVFVASPYLATDIRSRFAYPESVAFCLLPVVMFYSLRAFASPRRSAWAILCGGIAWAMVALSHNIVYLYGSALIGLFFLTCFAFNRRSIGRLARVGLSYGVGVVLCVWYVVPQFRGMQYINISATPPGIPLGFQWLVPLRVLFSPFLTVVENVGTPNLGLQIGWPILATVLIAVAQLTTAILRRRRSPLARYGLLLRLLVAWLIAVLLVWSPVDPPSPAMAIWGMFPSLFYNVQFPYRLLMFVVLWGALLVAPALAICFRRRPMPAVCGLAALLLVGVATMPHVILRHALANPEWTRQVVENPNIGPQSTWAYQPSAVRMDAERLTVPDGVRVIPEAETTPRVKLGEPTTYTVELAERAVARLPVMYYPDLMEVRDQSKSVVHGHIDGRVAVLLEPGKHRVKVRFVGFRWANWVSAAAWVAVLVGLGWLGLRSLVRGWRTRTCCPFGRTKSLLPSYAMLVAFVALAAPMAMSAVWADVSQHFRRKSLGTITASSQLGEPYRVDLAFDGDPKTAWVAADSNPTHLVIERPSGYRVSRLELEGRQTALLEAWHEVRVILYSGGAKVGEQAFVLPEAGRKALQELKLDHPAVADRVELHFDRPVTLRLDTGEDVPVWMVKPGYTEIRID